MSKFVTVMTIIPDIWSYIPFDDYPTILFTTPAMFNIIRKNRLPKPAITQLTQSINQYLDNQAHTKHWSFGKHLKFLSKSELLKHKSLSIQIKQCKFSNGKFICKTPDRKLDYITFIINCLCSKQKIKLLSNDPNFIIRLTFFIGYCNSNGYNINPNKIMPYLDSKHEISRDLLFHIMPELKYNIHDITKLEVQINELDQTKDWIKLQKYIANRKDKRRCTECKNISASKHNQNRYQCIKCGSYEYIEDANEHYDKYGKYSIDGYCKLCGYEWRTDDKYSTSNYYRRKGIRMKIAIVNGDSSI